MDERIIQAMEAGDTVVTATRRLARACRLAHAERQRAAGLDCWETPPVLSWEAWLRDLWQEVRFDAGDAGVLLAADQTAAVWRRLLAASDIELLDVGAAARGVEEAWRLLHAWRLELPEHGGHWGEDVGAFIEWARAYRDECAARGWLDPARLPDRLAALFADGTAAPPAALRLAGFDEFTPQQERLLAAVEAAGARVERLPLPACDGERRRTVCHDDEDELARAAAWARTCLERDPEARVAVVVPALAGRRAHLQRVFDDVLQPRALAADAAPPPAYNISLGRPLDSYPMVRAALRILALLSDRIEVPELGALLRSPFVAGGEREASGRALLDARLRRRGEPVVRLADVLYATDAGRGAGLAPAFAAALRRLSEQRRETGGRRTPGLWAALFSESLKILGWPGERTPDSAEYQQIRAWEETLDRLAALDAVTGAMDRAEALTHLRRLAADTVFQPHTPARRLQAMGPLEALGQRFDHIWIAGLDDDEWPPAPRPNPWLPVSLQREHGLPHAGAAREREYVERLTGHLLGAAPDVVVSHARWDGDRERAVSPLVEPLVEESPPWAPETGAVPHALRDAVALANEQERIEDLIGPPLAAARAPGGAGALESQSACPMQAFGRYRLQARQLERPRLGIDARERGQLLHRTLELFFERHDTGAALAALEESGRDAAVRECAEAAVAELARKRPHTFSERFRAIEVETLAALAAEWLVLEAQRPDFRVLAREELATVTLADTEFRLKLDRVDELEDGRQLIIDYKTGKVSDRDWDGERPSKPQLPLYALTRPAEELAGVAFAVLRPGGARFQGCLAPPAVLPGVEPLADGEFRRRLDEWRSVLENLAAAFAAGAAEPDPRHPDVCNYCDLHGLCRIAEIRAEAT